MSLIHWWPLTEDLNDKIGLTPLVSSRWFLENDSTKPGKIGKCYNTNEGDIARIDALTMPNTFSFACWIKNYDLTYPRTTLPIYFGAGAIYQQGNIGWDFGHGANGEPERSDYRIALNDGVNIPLNFYWSENGYNPDDLLNTWYHIVVVVDYNKKRIILYINGHCLGEQTIPETFQGFAGTRQLVIGNLSGWTLFGHINDVRIYDHALSTAEIQELKKALVVHYTFDDVLTEPTNNLITGLRSGGRTSYDSTNSTITTAGENQDTYFYLLTSEPIVEGLTYTLSCQGKNIGNGKQFIFGMQGQSSAHHQFTITEGYNEFTFVANNYINGLTTILMDDTLRTGWENKAIFSQFQLEKKDHATPYTPSNRAGMLYNETGLIQPDNSTIQNIQLVTDAAINTYSLKCNNTKILTPIAGDISQGATLSLWINLPKDNSGKNIFPSSSEVVVADQNSKLAFGFYNEAHGIITCNGFEKPIMAELKNALKHNWNHVAVIRDGNNIKGYLNGVEYPLTGSQEWTHSEQYFSIGCRYSGSWTSYYNGQVDDIRLYNNCLSPEEIKDLYDCGGRISNLGDALTGSFIEGAATAKVNKNHTIEMNEFIENDEGKALIKKGNILSSREIIET